MTPLEAETTPEYNDPLIFEPAEHYLVFGNSWMPVLPIYKLNLENIKTNSPLPPVTHLNLLYPDSIHLLANATFQLFGSSLSACAYLCIVIKILFFTDRCNQLCQAVDFTRKTYSLFFFSVEANIPNLILFITS